MAFANYIPLSDEIEMFSGEIVFEGEKHTHILINGTDTIAVVPNEDVYPS